MKENSQPIWTSGDSGKKYTVEKNICPMEIKYMLFWQPGKKYMPNGNKIYAFLTSRKKIYDQWEKNICPMGKKYMPNGKKIYDFFTSKKKIYSQWEQNIWQAGKKSTYLNILFNELKLKTNLT